jgi:diguanylate cyclase (GGDEF)-like protein
MPNTVRRKVLVFGGAAVGTAAIGWIDYATGIEVRVFPLYFAPISLVAWSGGRAATVATALLCSFAWGEANRRAGLEFSQSAIWSINVLAQSAAFLFVGLLMASLRHALEREQTLSRTDALTHLPNSRAFYEEAERVLARSKRHRRPLSVAYIDVDDFKKVNDTFGHHAGDELLKTIGAVLIRTLRVGDLAARLGGDEFAVLLEETDQEGAKAFLARARDELASRSPPRPSTSRPASAPSHSWLHPTT